MIIKIESLRQIELFIAHLHNYKVYFTFYFEKYNI